MTKISTSLFIAILLLVVSQSSNAQIVINSTYKPLSIEELFLQAWAEHEHDKKMEKLFDEYQEKAYQCYNRNDLEGFLTYSNYALKTGWYSDKLYYDRGIVYERLNNFKQAKKEFKKAKKHGYVYAETALENLKRKEKIYKEEQKNFNKNNR